MLSTAIDDLKRWTSSGLPLHTVSVHVSFRRLSDEDLVAALRPPRVSYNPPHGGDRIQKRL